MLRNRFLITLLSLFAFSATVAAEDRQFHYVDLQQQATHPLAEDFQPGDYPGDNLAELPTGYQRFGAIDFHVGKRLIEVKGKHLPDRPLRVEGIPVNAHFETLHILQGARWGAYGKRGDNFGHWGADGTPIGYYEVIYTDGKAEAIPIVYGVDVRDWWSVWDDSKPTKRGRVVWTGTNSHLQKRREARGIEGPLRLYHLAWKNPCPDTAVATISLISLDQTATPFCVAMTVENTEARESAPPVRDAQIRELEDKLELLNQKIDQLMQRLEEK